MLKRATFVTPADEYEHRYDVALGASTATRRGLFVELRGPSNTRVQENVEATLSAMMARRARTGL